MKRSTISCVARLASTVGLLLCLVSPAHAQATEVSVQLGPDTDMPIAGAAFDYEVVVDFPAGLYTGARVKAFLPPGITRGASGSPTSGEFDNGVYNSGENSITWIQQVPEIDVLEGSGVRKFTIEVSIPRHTVRDGQPFTFRATANGDQNDLPFPEATDEQVITARGQGLVLSLSYNASIRYGLQTGRWGLSDEPTPRPGWFGNIVVPSRNAGTGPTDPGATFAVEVGAGYYLLSAVGNGVTVSGDLTPYQRGGSFTGVRSIGSTNGLNGYVAIGVFVPCEDFGKTAAQEAEVAPTFVSRGSITASGTDYFGVVDAQSVDGADIAGPNLEVVCGSGGSFNTDFVQLVNAGTRASWKSTTSPPAGVTSITDAMMVNAIPPEATGFGMLTAGGYPIGLADFTQHFCNFSALGGAHFSVSEFLATRDANCRDTWASGDTHLVHYSPEWRANEDGVMSSISIYFYVDVTEAYSLAHIGERLVNRGYFNGTTIYGTRGDQDATNDAADTWQDAAGSTPFPLDAGRLSLGVATSGSPTSPVDANEGNGVATWTFGNDATLRWPINPEFSITAPPGIIITNFVFTATNCEAPVPAGIVPTAPFGSTIAFKLGSESEPWRIAGEGCGGTLRVNFKADRLYPFFDNQVVSFVVNGTVDNQTGPITTLSTAFTSTRLIVTTGMDVQLEGGCWNEPVEGVTPSGPGLVLFKATAINRGSEDLEAMELRFIMPPGATYQTAFAGPDFPAETTIEVSRNGGATWANAPAGADPTVTDVRISGFVIAGAGLDALRPSFYVAVSANDPNAIITAKAWSETPTQGLGRTPEKEVPIDAAQCRPACDCPDPTPNDPCSTGGCDAQGACIQVNEEDQASCQFEGDLCVTAAACSAGVCTATTTTSCGDENTCTRDSCDPETGLCGYRPVFDCANKRPFYLPVSRDNKVVGSVLCFVVLEGGRETVECDAEGNRLNLHAEHSRACGN